jgi:UTP:GlnB (protein PII) uridylyltransferase
LQPAKTVIKLKNEADSPFTKMTVTTHDRPGLLVDIVRTLKDCSVQVISAEVDTIGTDAQDEFMLTYHGEPLARQMRLLVKNALQYYLSLADIETEESY